MTFKRPYILVSVLMLSLLPTLAMAQETTSPTDGRTPSAATPGSPAGAYTLSNFENVNLYNGNLNVRLPLIRVGGRGSAGYTMMLALNTKGWNMKHQIKIMPDESEVHIYTPTTSSCGAAPAGYSVGRLSGRHMGLRIGSGFNGTNKHYNRTLARLTFTTADGTEYELRDQLTDGKPLDSTFTQGAFRGHVFVTADGTSATYISDAAIYDNQVYNGQGCRPVASAQLSGYLILRDGTRFRIDTGNVTWMRDSNGNQLSFTYSSNVMTVTDSRGRQVTVTSNVADGAFGTCTRITFDGTGGAQRVIRVCQSNLQNVLRNTRPGDLQQTQTLDQLFPEADEPNSTGSTLPHNPIVVSSVWLPDEVRRYQFFYNVYGELTRTVLPTDGAIEYDMPPGSGIVCGAGGPGGTCGYGDDLQIYRRVKERRVYAGSSAAAPLLQKTTYSNVEEANGASSTIKVEHVNPAGVVQARSRHIFNGSAMHSLFSGAVTSPYGTWFEGREKQTEVLNTAGAFDTATVLRRVVNTWVQRAPVAWWAAYASSQGLDVTKEPPQDPRLISTVTTIEPASANLVTKQTFAYDRYNNQTDTFEYDFGTGSAPLYPVRHSQTTFITTANGQDYACDPTTTCSNAQITTNIIHLRTLPQHTRTFSVNPANGQEALAAHTEMLYDETALNPWYGAVTGWADPGAYRGNPTKVKRWRDLPTAIYLETRVEFDQVGNFTKSIDPLGRTTTVTYSPTFAFALPTSRTSPIPDPTSQYGSATALTTLMDYDLSTGLITSTTDANNKTTTFEYNDPLDRLTRVNFPDGGRTTHIYVDVHQCGPFRESRTVLNSSGQESSSFTFFDGLGRSVRTFIADPQDPAKPYQTQDTEYDALGRAWRVSSPYRSTGCTATINPSGRWTETTFDALDRATQVKTTGDNAAVTTEYSGNQSTVTDQDLKKQTSVTDALGRLTRVIEDPQGLAYQTNYTYDALSNLRKVDQAGQSRYFIYDSLGQLLRAKNPEQAAFSADADFPAMTDPISGNSQWSLGYTYDAVGNLAKRKDARNITMVYQYDNLNRVKTVDYSNTTLNPDVKRIYDGAVDGRGMPWKRESTGASGSLSTVTSYDAAGRPRAEDHQFWNGTAWSTPFNVQYEYHLAGNIKKVTYPSGRSVSYTYDAAARLASVSGNLGDGAQRTYADQIRYHESGRMEQERFGTNTPVFNKSFYNVRGQLSDIRVSTYSITTVNKETDWNRGAILNHFSYAVWGGSDNRNNGNVRTQQTWIPNDDQISGFSLYEQFYTYDSLNRLSSVREGGQWQQTYDYDRWGNRTINAAQTWLGQSSAPPSVLVNETQFDQADLANTNRLYAPGDTALAMSQRRMQYDAAGNIVVDNYTGQGSRSYDAEGRMTSAQWFDGQVRTASYVYDADGRRVQRMDGVGPATWQVYGIDGELLAEYESITSPAAPKKEYAYQAGELLLTAEASARTNHALSANGGIATASSTHPSHSVAALNNGDRKGINFGGIWGDNTPFVYPDWVQIDFPSQKQIDEITVVSMQNNYSTPVEPTDTMTGSTYVITSFEAQYWTGTTWATVPGGSVTGNNLIVRRVTFPAVTTSKIRVVINSTPDNHSQVPELEAWGPGARTNHAVSASGGIATASSTHPSHSVAAVNNGDRKGINFGGIWGDNTPFVYPDWVQIDFPSQKQIDEITVVSMQNNYSTPVEPTDTMTGSTYVITSFEAQYWTGTTWATVPGGSVTGNNLIVRRVTFPAVTTSKIRVVINSTPDNHSQVPELEAWGPGGGGGSLKWLVSDQLGTPRMIIDQSGSLAGVTRHDYMPFGEEVMVGRLPEKGYRADSVKQKFTSKERDIETGLDYFLARYYSSIQGRFTSPDPTLLSVNGLNPQTWNRYTYVLNNPLAFVDPLGLWALQTETIYKRDKDGNFERDSQGRLKVERVVVTAVRTSDKDTGASLAKQLGLTGREAEAFAQRVGDGNNIRLSQQGGDVGRVFGAVERGLKEQAKFEIEHPNRQNQGPDSADCSETACRIAFPQQMFGTLTFSVQEADATIGAPGATTSVQESNLRLGDIVRWADARNNPKHFASFVFRNDDGVPVVFSKSGARGPYETVTTSEIGTKYPGYGTIRGIRSDQTGYYHPR